jgi:hypothetical protein
MSSSRSLTLTLALSGWLLLCGWPRAAVPQEIYQAVVLDLTVLEVQVIVAGARGDEQVQCLLRTDSGEVRHAGARPISAGLVSGRTTILSVPLPLLNPGEREFAVALIRDRAVVTQTPWRPLFASTKRPP